MAARGQRAPDFDSAGLFAAMDAQRIDRGISWRQVAQEMWDQSRALNLRRRDHPISASTLTNIAQRGDTTCQHALFVLRWLGRSPESFLPDPPAAGRDAPLPHAGEHQRLRWNLPALATALDDRRQQLGLTWTALAAELGCSGNQLSGLRTVRYAIRMSLCMRIVRWLGRPSADFIDAAGW